jgi:hypothetical protein
MGIYNCDWFLILLTKGLLFCTEHCFQYLPYDDGKKTLFINSDYFGGLLGRPMFLASKGKLRSTMKEFNQGLKKYVEELK